MMPLERKIPMIPGPKDAYNLTRCKVGEKVWATDGPRMDFDPSDPCCRETRFSYEALHDQHLLRFFSKPTYRRCLLRASLITKDMDVKCSLREYNAYRKYLRKIYANRIGKELRKRDRLSVERRALRYAEEQARNKAERLNKREELANTERRVARQRLLEEEVEIQKQKEKAYKVACRSELSKLVEQEERRLMSVKRKERAE
ncbi:stress response protein NST1 [Ooceraea biroi]|uniref:stress response protein NST1 n=1 Tax=Ooceraea biroi TaxID=2015173 RepID=UPI000F080D4F|nr:stress response protein NST1 [Ooceraea biroi]